MFGILFMGIRSNKLPNGGFFIIKIPEAQRPYPRSETCRYPLNELGKRINFESEYSLWEII